MKKALVLGLGISGKSAANYLLEEGYHVVGVDDSGFIEIPGVEFAYTKEIFSLSDFHLFVPSPGISRKHPLWFLAQREGIETAGEVELAMRIIDQPCIGVTGSNGKTTVVKLIEHCFNISGIKAKALGNVGDALLTYLKNPCKEEILVIELSSFQLETLKTSKLHVALILNITENHLDRYENFMEYATTKIHIQNCLQPKGILGADTKVISCFSHLFYQKPQHFGMFSKTTSFEEENIAAAYFATQHFGITKDLFFSAVKSFSKPKHRLEFVAQVNDVIYYNDSKATSPAAVDGALKFFKDKRVILLAGGIDKGLSFTSLVKHKDKIVCLIAFGQCGHKIGTTLGEQTPKVTAATVAAAVALAAEMAKKGDIVLFSPGGTSFDAFADYNQRGEEFKRCVNNLRRKNL